MKAIETIYNGYRFRSRLEARWAVFFDTFGIEYQYEPEGFDLDGDWYLPDFYFPKQDFWLEVKPSYPNINEQRKVLNLFIEHNAYLKKDQNEIKCAAGFICGSPWPPKFTVDNNDLVLLDGYIILTPNIILDCWDVQAFKGTKDSWDIWPIYVTADFGGTFDAQKQPDFEMKIHYYSLQLPLNYMHRFYVGSGDSYVTDDLMRAYKAARQARFGRNGRG